MSTFTPEQIQEILDLYFENFAHRQYIGARYVPIFGRKNEDSIEWDNTGTYEPLTIVLYQGNSFTSRQFVPIGVDITNENYWAETGNYNAQIEAYRQEVLRFDDRITANSDDIDKYAYPKNNPVYYGADPTGVNDSADAINECLAENINGEVIFSPGIYKCESAIMIDYNNYKLTIDFNGCKIINQTNCKKAIAVGFLNKTTTHANYGTELVNRNYTYLKNLYLETNCDIAIDVANWFTNLHMENISIICDKNGIRYGGREDGVVEANHPIDAQLTDFYICNTNAEHTDTIGIEYLGSDSKANNGRIYGFQTGIKTFGGEWFDQIHFLLTMVYDEPVFDSSYHCIESYGSLRCTNVYCDTMPQFLKYISGGWVNIDGLFIYSYNSNLLEDCVIFDFENSKNYIVNFKLSNVAFYNSNYPADTIFLKSVYPFELQTPSSITLRSQEFIRMFKTNERNISGNIYIQDAGKMLQNTNRSKDLLWCEGKEIIPKIMTTELDADVWSYICSIPISFVNQYVLNINNLSTPGGNLIRYLHGKFSITFNNDRNAVGNIVKIDPDSNINLGCKIEGLYCHVYGKPASNWTNNYKYFYPLQATCDCNLADCISDFQYQYESAMVTRFGDYYHPTGSNFDYTTNF